MLSRAAIFTYGVLSYAVFFVTFLYLAGFLANFMVPKGIDTGATIGGIGALAINIGLLTLFGLQHSVMARPGFKKVWTRIIPKAAERSTYVLLTSLVLILMYAAWQPMTGVVWMLPGSFGQILGHGGLAIGFLIVLITTFLIDHFDLFGLRQVTLNLLQKRDTPAPFQVRYFYKFVRHPLYLGWLIAFWATPVMTVGHLIFAIGMTAYILIAVQFEERDLIDAFGEDYRRYQKEVPMIIPTGAAHATVHTAKRAHAGSTS